MFFNQVNTQYTFVRARRLLGYAFIFGRREVLKQNFINRAATWTPQTSLLINIAPTPADDSYSSRSSIAALATITSLMNNDSA